MRSSHIVASALGGLLVTLVACSTASTNAGGDSTDAGAQSDADAATSSGGDPADTGPAPEAAPPTIVGPGNDKCADATVIALDASKPRFELKATTTGSAHDVDAPCSAEQGADSFYKFSVSKRVFVYADTFGASWNTTLFFLDDTCKPITTTATGDAVCNDDACGSSQSQIVARLEPGTYRLGIAGHGAAQGDATIHFEWTLAGSGTATALPKGASVQTGTTMGSEGNIDDLSPNCLAAGAENSYFWARCPSDPGGALSASTCGGAAFESIVEIQIPQSIPYACNIDGCGLQGNLHATVPAGAGLAVVSVDGQDGNDVGPYTLTVDRP